MTGEEHAFFSHTTVKCILKCAPLMEGGVMFRIASMMEINALALLLFNILFPSPSNRFSILESNTLALRIKILFELAKQTFKINTSQLTCCQSRPMTYSRCISGIRRHVGY